MNKVRSNVHIVLSKNDRLIRNEYNIANTCNNFFINVVPNLGIKANLQHICNISNISDPVEKAIKKYQKHPSISIIKKVISSVDKETAFFYTCVTSDDILEEIRRPEKKATQGSDTPTKAIKQFPSLIIDFLNKNITCCLTEGTFPNDFKKTVRRKTHKNDYKTKNPNYRQIIILPNLLKVYERL